MIVIVIVMVIVIVIVIVMVIVNDSDCVRHVSRRILTQSHPTMDVLATMTNLTLIQDTLPIQIKEQPWVVLRLLNS